MLAPGALVGVVVAAAAATAPGPADGPPAAQSFATPGAAITAALDETHFAGGVVAFGELHQTLATAGVPSALKRFTEQIFPGLAGRFGQLVVETWMTTGRCGEAEKAVTADVQKTTERPAQTETEIETLLRVAHDGGVQPRILTIGCQDYQAMRASGAVDYDRTLRVTTGALDTAIARALRAVAAAGPRLVAVYGGALHNDLRPDPALDAYSFAPAVLRATLGHYVEIDLVVPEYAETSAAVKAQPWWRTYRAARQKGRYHGKAAATILIRRDARSFVVVFPGVTSAKRGTGPSTGP